MKPFLLNYIAFLLERHATMSFIPSGTRFPDIQKHPAVANGAFSVTGILSVRPVGGDLRANHL